MGIMTDALPRVHRVRTSPLKQRSRVEEHHRQRVMHHMLTKSSVNRIQAFSVLQRRGFHSQDGGRIEQVVDILKSLSQSLCGLEHLRYALRSGSVNLLTLSFLFRLPRCNTSTRFSLCGFKSLESLVISTKALADLSDLGRLRNLTLWGVERHSTWPGKPLLPRLEALERLILHFVRSALPTVPVVEQFIDLGNCPTSRRCS